MALLYTRTDEQPPEHALIFRILVNTWMQKGANITFLSAFPHEIEYLYPPLTHIEPRKERRLEPIRHDRTTYDIVECVATFPKV